MNFKKTLMAAAIALSLTAPAAIAAQDTTADRKAAHKGAAFHGHRGFGKHMFGRAAAGLNLTDQQKEYAKQLFADTRKQAEPLVAQMRENRKEMAEAVKANNTSAIDQISQRQATLMSQITAMHGKAMASFYAQLTPEQRAKADELHNRMRDRVKERASRWRQDR